jgi:hypothetical protein
MFPEDPTNPPMEPPPPAPPAPFAYPAPGLPPNTADPYAASIPQQLPPFTPSQVSAPLPLQPQTPPMGLEDLTGLVNTLSSARRSRTKDRLTDALGTFVFSLAQGMSAAGQVPGGSRFNAQRNAAAMGGALQGTQILQQMRQQQLAQQQKLAIEQQLAQAQLTRAQTPPQRNIDPLSPQGIAADVTKQRLLATIKPSPPDNASLVSAILDDPQMFNRLPTAMQTSLTPELGRKGFKFPAAPKDEKPTTLTPDNVTLDGKPAMVLRDNQGNFFELGTKKPITGRITPYIAPPTPRARGEITPTAEAGLIQQLNKQWETASKDVQAMYRANTIMDAGMEAARHGDMNAGSQAILVTFQKFLDPTSVVRESEYARSPEGISVANRIRGYVDRLTQGGAGVPLDELEKFARMAKNINQKLAAEGTSLLSAEKKRILSVADRYSIPAEMVIPKYNFAQPGGTAPAASNGMINVRLPNGRSGQIPKDKLESFLRDNPGAKQVP